MFESAQGRVVLIKKNRPENQKGLLNGVGGRIEENETPFEAMAREFEEETGMLTDPQSWLLFHKEIQSDIVEGVLTEKELLFFVCEGQDLYNKVRSATDEEVVLQYVGKDADMLSFCVVPAMYNLRYLVPMARVFLDKPENRQIVRTQ
jgi:8-oxo-dGTP diphosphatase